MSAEKLPLPVAVVRDEAGAVMEPAPLLEYTVSPPGIVAVQGSHLLPIQSGSALLQVATKKGSAVARVPLEVRLVDRIDLSCPSTGCAFRVGDEVLIGATLFSEGVALKGVTARWTVEPSYLLEAIEPGRFRARQAGRGRVMAAAGQVRGVREVRVAAPVDRIELLCPPLFLVQGPGLDRVCTVRQGKNVVLEVKATGQGEPVPEPPVHFVSDDTDIARVGGSGSVFAAGAGRTEIRVTSGAVSATLPLEVLPSCLGNWKWMSLETRDERGWIVSRRELWCRSFQPRTCLDRAISLRGATQEAFEACCCSASKPIEIEPSSSRHRRR